METKGIRYDYFEDEELLSLLQEKNENLKKLYEMQEGINKIEEEGRSLSNQIQKIKDKAIPLGNEKTKNIPLKRNLVYDCPNCKWEIITQLQVNDSQDGKIAVQILDLIDAEKERILTEEQRKNENTVGSPSA